MSHTNESNRIETFKAVREWVLRNPDPRYKEVVESRCETGSLRDMNELMALLIEMARVTGGINQERTQVDADVQVALAVLLNTVEVKFSPYKRCNLLIEFRVGLSKGARLLPDSSSCSP